MAQPQIPIMVDDTNGEAVADQSGSSLLSRLAGITSFRIGRTSALAWSQNLDFLTYDDAIETGHEGQDPAEESELPWNRKTSCDMCMRIPIFPKGSVQNFRIRKQIREGDNACFHYLAVSYCWPKDPQGNPTTFPKTYMVRSVDEEGLVRERANRAPDSVIERAVEIARAYGIRQIWIDQECLPQDNSPQQELGIQAMDMVYQNATLIAGLLDSVIDSSEQLGSLTTVIAAKYIMIHEYRTGVSQMPAGSHLNVDIPAFVTFLEALTNDQWYTRAWILQESLAADNRLLLSMKHGDSFGASRASDVSQFMAQSVPGSLLLSTRDFQSIIDISSRTLSFVRRISRPGDFTDRLMQRARLALTHLGKAQPHAMNVSSSIFNFTLEGGSSHGSRKRCSMAVAVTYLKTRKNYRAVDRLAIVANMCDYEYRLDTAQLETRFKSLSECLLALSVSNGDLSLLNPDIYTEQKQKEGEFPSWLLKIHTALRSIDSQRLVFPNAISQRISAMYRISEKGFSCPGYLFSIDRSVDFTPIREKWRWHYRWLQAQKVTDFEGKTEEEKQAAYEEVGRKFMRVQKGWQRPDAALASAHIPTTAGLSTEAVGSSVYHQAIVGNIVLDVLYHLVGIGEMALANSLWLSLRSDVIVPDDGRETHSFPEEVQLPDDVVELLKDDSLHEDVWKLIQIDQGKAGIYYQSWLFHRILEDGKLWVGSYVPHTAKAGGPPAETPVEAAEEGNEESKSSLENLRQLTEQRSTDVISDQPQREMPTRSQKMKTHIQSDALTDRTSNAAALVDKDALSSVQKSASTQQKLQQSSTPAIRWRSKILHRQMRQQMSIYQLRVAIDYSRPSDGADTAAFIALSAMLARNTHSSEAERAREGQVASFDVDGPCLVMVPFDADVERLPHPEERAMSLSWVVERDTDFPWEFDGRNSSQQPGRYCVLAKVKGAYEIMELPLQCYMIG